jgi:hypothetical protein
METSEESAAYIEIRPAEMVAKMEWRYRNFELVVARDFLVNLLFHGTINRYEKQSGSTPSAPS